MKDCLMCGKGQLAYTTRVERFEYKGQFIEIPQAGEFCSNCDEGVIDGITAKATEHQLHDWRATIDGYLPSTEVRRIRNKLGLTQKEAGEIFGGGPNAFSRYENGEALQLKSTDNLLRLLDRHPHLLREIQEQPDGEGKQATGS